MNRVLMIAFHFPPLMGSSGLQRTLAFARYLPQFDWEPTVLTVHPRVYPRVCDAQLKDVPDSTLVRRTFALDVARHLAIRGRYLEWLALPDRWNSWWLSAVPAGLALIRRLRPRVIWSTYPIATAHLIGLTLHRLTGIPWVADCRDWMTFTDSVDAMAPRWRVNRWIERHTMAHCSRTVFTTRGAVKMYRNRYPKAPQYVFRLIENGFDEENFRAAEHTLATHGPDANSRLTLLHSGLLDRDDRNPGAFFQALEQLKRAGRISSAGLRVVLRAPGIEEPYVHMLRERGIEDIVSLGPAIPYNAALAEMLTAHGLLLFQSSACNEQIPAKLYEYLRAGRPVFAMVDPVGNTAERLRSVGIDSIAPLDDPDQIMKRLDTWLTHVRSGNAPTAAAEEVAQHSRRARTKELAQLLEEL